MKSWSNELAVRLLSTSVEAEGFKINMGNFSNVIKELVNVADTAVALDDTQYLLCMAISDKNHLIGYILLNKK